MEEDELCCGLVEGSRVLECAGVKYLWEWHLGLYVPVYKDVDFPDIVCSDCQKD